ncbi:glycoside hydrolase family 18 protein [Tilletiaria anomala UBC 951]|uniref:Glycoside hydrolase family 18 protein n=1 Tax=Tilletiaria anomala (strain ATCC 24038 / CBS 436.72 / UBC 951) TaxID=1037660 RepID=A0A066VMF6_TILAU|nr:glycoside hydrolase family 18 protein [Tilletiaria anomala UBC 951]KDN39765.1 glycoside hydrolase family 18 protein [Tilletiaria anomala UBC 951]
MPPESIDFSRYDIIYFAFAVPSSSFGVSFTDGGSRSLLQRLVNAAHASQTKVILALGGWGQSDKFSPAVATSSSRSTFINSIMGVYQKYDLDGIDIDWEYPNADGAGNNQKSAADAANLQTFFQELRSALPQGALITAAVPHLPWIGSNGSPVRSVARAASVIDYVFIMNYDVWGSSSNPAPNAPLANLCDNSTQPQASAAAGVRQWVAAGMPASKIMLGLPAYGYVSNSGVTSIREGRRELSIEQQQQQGQMTLPAAHRRFASQAGAMDPPGYRGGRFDRRLLSHRALSSASFTKKPALTEGQTPFRTLVTRGALVKRSDGTYDAGAGWTRRMDRCSDTPFLYNGKQAIMYDDTQSILDKAAFAKQTGIAGVGFWSVDSDTSTWDLTNAAIKGLQS